MPRQQNLATVDAMLHSARRSLAKVKGWFVWRPSSPPHAIQTRRGSPSLAQSQDTEWENVAPSGIGEEGSRVEGEGRL
jgi:hypothetical protein